MSLPDFSLNLVDSVESAGRFLTWLGERRPVLAIYTETTGTGWTDTVRLVQFGDGAGGWAVPIRNWRGVAAAALAGAVDLIAAAGGGVVEGYPEDVAGRGTAAFLHSGTLAMFERAGFVRDRRIGKAKWVVHRAVEAG